MTEQPAEPRVELLTPEHRQQVANWRFLAKLVAVAFFAQTLVFGWYVYTSTASRQHDQAVSDCRGKNAAAMTSAQVENQIAFNALLAALADPSRRVGAVPGKNPYQHETDEIARTGRDLKAARDARAAFEKHPTSRC